MKRRVSIVKVRDGRIEEAVRQAVALAGRLENRIRSDSVAIVLGESACTGCVCELISALCYVREAGFDQAMEALSVVLGEPPAAEVPKDKVVLMGKCSKSLAENGLYVKGCPPKEDDMIKAVCKICRVDADEVMTSTDLMRQRFWDATKANLEG